MTPADRVRGLKMALQVIAEKIARDPCSGSLLQAKAVLRGELERAKALEQPRSLKQIAVIAGVSEETIRRRIHERCPEAKIRGRFRIKPEMMPVILQND